LAVAFLYLVYTLWLPLLSGFLLLLDEEASKPLDLGGHSKDSSSDGEEPGMQEVD
jgi:hypothetical protein